MILQALAGYYQRMAEEGDDNIAQDGFEKKEIPFLIILDRQGAFVDLQDTREGDGKKKHSRTFMVPKGVKKTSGIAANFLWDTPNYVIGVPKLDAKKDAEVQQKRALEQQERFIEVIRERFPEPVEDEGVRAVLAFLEQEDYASLFAHPSWKEIAESGPNITFKLESDSGLVCQRGAVINAVSGIANTGGSEAGERQTCLVTGEDDVPVRLHSSIKGVWGAQSSGANIVSFNLGAFCSYGKGQGLNAPVGKKAEFAYTTALNNLLLKGSRQRLQVGDCSTVFWAEKKSQMEDVFADLFGEPAKENPDQLNAAVQSLFEAPKTGAPPLEDDYTRFYVLGLAPNAARIAVRFWQASTVGETAHNIKRHFEDCDIIHGPNQPLHLSLFRLLVSTAVQGKSENIPPNLAGDFMKAILAGTPYPKSALVAVINRTKAEQSKKDQNGKSVQNVTYPRAALIKALLTRETRYYKKSEKEVGMSLDSGNTNVGYRIGRLFAVLEKIQEEASPGISATIRDRFYGAASSTPVTAFPHLMKLKNHHLAKLENRGRAVNLEKLIGEIMDGVTDFPSHLSLQDQGRFAVGYYHQRQDFFTKKENQ